MVFEQDTLAKNTSPIRPLPFNTLVGRALVVLTNGPADQSFLGNPLLPALIRAVPAGMRRSFVLRLLSISPHYFTEIGSSRYPISMSKAQILERELERNVVSRRQLADEVIGPFLQPDMRVLDFGCGVGILASQMADRCREATGVDISCGALACGAVLFQKQNLQFAAVTSGRIEAAAEQSFDLITAIAVMQHMSDSALEQTVREFHRILAPGGTVLCHIPLVESAAMTPQATLHQDKRNPVLRRLQRRYGLLMLYRERVKVDAMLDEAGFTIESVRRIGDMAKIDDDIAHQELFILRRNHR